MRIGRRLGVVAPVAVALLGGGVGWAAWVNSGTGPGLAQATTAIPLAVAAATPVGSLYPMPAGGYSSPTIGAVYTTVANPNPYPVVGTAAVIGTPVVTPLTGKVCAATNVVPTSAAALTLATPLLLPASSSQTPLTIPGAVQMIPSAEDGCQGAQISVPVTLTGSSTP